MGSRGREPKVVKNELDLLTAKNSANRVDPKSRDQKDEKPSEKRDKDREPRKDDRETNRTRERIRDREDSNKRDKTISKDREKPRAKDERRDSKGVKDIKDRDRERDNSFRRRSRERSRDRSEPNRRIRDDKDPRKDERKREPEKPNEKVIKRKKAIDESSSEEEEFEVAPSIFGKPLPNKVKKNMGEEDMSPRNEEDGSGSPSTSGKAGQLTKELMKGEPMNSLHSAPSPSPPSPESDFDYEMPTGSVMLNETKEETTGDKDEKNDPAKQSLSDKTAVFRQAIEHMIGWTAPPDDPPQKSPDAQPQKRRRSCKEFADRYRQHIHEEAKATVVQWYYNREIDKEEYKEVMKEIVKPCLKYQIRSKSEIRKRAIKVLQEWKTK